ncbi:MAG: DUF6194 family protein [Chloroflexota bacterium]|nr:DUF6194 family protein [Chloroflexota bacterium]
MPAEMDQASITRYIGNTFYGVDCVVGSKESGSPEIAWGDTFFIYDPDRSLDANRRFPFATIVTKDYPDDREANLDRPSVFRLNIGVSKGTYAGLFGDAETGYDYAALDRLLPHPVYGRMHWVCVLNPSPTTFESLRPLLAEAYELAVARQTRARG